MMAGLILSCLHYISLHLPPSLSSPLLLLVGRVYNHDHSKNHQNETVNEGDEWSMEVDLRSGEKEKRTVHWFVNDEQQTGFIKGVPAEVEFGV